MDTLTQSSRNINQLAMCLDEKVFREVVLMIAGMFLFHLAVEMQLR